MDPLLGRSLTKKRTIIVFVLFTSQFLALPSPGETLKCYICQAGKGIPDRWTNCQDADGVATSSSLPSEEHCRETRNYMCGKLKITNVEGYTRLYKGCLPNSWICVKEKAGKSGACFKLNLTELQTSEDACSPSTPKSIDTGGFSDSDLELELGRTLNMSRSQLELVPGVEVCMCSGDLCNSKFASSPNDYYNTSGAHVNSVGETIMLIAIVVSLWKWKAF